MGAHTQLIDCPGRGTSLTCAADFGVEEAVKIEGLGKADVSKQLEALVQRGEQMPRSTESVGAL